MSSISLTAKKKTKMMKIDNPQSVQVNDTHYAFAKGYYDGLVDGIENNIYKQDLMRYFYRNGYDAGIAEYCNKTHPDE